MLIETADSASTTKHVIVALHDSLNDLLYQHFYFPLLLQRRYQILKYSYARFF